jgi:glycosyltransferase involved in cell wall biosynthesis
MESCVSCPQVDEELSWLPEFNLKSRSTLWNLPLTFICPSKWIEEKLIKSRVFNYENHQSHVISNSIDLNTFRPIDGISINSLKMELDIEQDSICLLAGSFSLDENRKGGKLIVDALKSLASLLEKQNISRKVVLLTYGEGSISIESLETKNLGFIKSEKQITLFLNVADLFLSMSREDNLPNTIMESLACGTPVISTNVGGISDMVVDNYNGRLIKRDNTRQMADTILHAVKNPKLVAEWSTNARKLAESNFSHQKQGLEYVKVFEHLLKESSLKSPAKKLSTKQTINNTVSRIPALNAFPSKSFREEALSWFEKQSSDEG